MFGIRIGLRQSKPLSAIAVAIRGLLLVGVAFCCGCLQQEGITTYTVAKPPPAVRPSTAARTTPRDARPSLPFTFTAPVEWTRKPAGVMRIAEWEAVDGERRVSITASTAGGDLASNVNRWRGQVGLTPASELEIAQALQKIALGALHGDYVELVGSDSSNPRQTILGVIVQATGRQWFFKLQGDTDLAKREQPRFEEFVKSIRFRETEGDFDGQ
jgi:hypothetical protein